MSGIEPGLILACSALIGMSILVRAVDHDESQYVSAIALMRQGLPFRDFAYLQTPLQPLLLAPISYLPAGSLLIAARFANAIFGIGTVFALLVGLKYRASNFAKLVALGGMVCSDAFLLASSLARNDALAMFLVAAALPPLLAAAETSERRLYFFAGILFGLAISTKISMALPAATSALFILVEACGDRRKLILAFAGGLLLGLAPTICMASLAPERFRFDVLTYNFEGPVQWWTSIGQGDELNPFRRLLKLIEFASLGSLLVALIATILDRNRDPCRRVLDFTVAGGLVAAFLPVPALVQYLVPVMPPLFMRFALALDAAPLGRKNTLAVLTAVGAFVGLTTNFAFNFGGLEIIRSVAIGRKVSALARGGRVVTLSGEYVAGSGVSLDQRFATGPFLFRTRGALAVGAQTEGQAVTAQSLETALDTNEPSVILVGAETQRFPPISPEGLDQLLIQWAHRHRYETHKLSGGFTALALPQGAQEVSARSHASPLDCRHQRLANCSHRLVAAFDPKQTFSRGY